MQASRLGRCEVCDKQDAKYCCPECEVKTCCLQCVNIHKKELNCSGTRNRVKFRKMKGFTNIDLLNDYRLLEEIGRSAEKYSKDKRVHNHSFHQLSTTHYRLRAAALKRNIDLRYLPKQFNRHKESSNYLNYKTQELFWRIEWIFAQALDTKYVDERVLDTELLGNVLDKYINPAKNNDNALQYYQSAGHPKIMILLKAENVPSERFFEMDPLVSLRDNLYGKIIIEFPTMNVIMKDHKECYDIISPDEEENILEQWKTERENNQLRKQQLNPKKRKRRGESLAEKNEDFRKNFFIANDNSDEDSDNRSQNHEPQAKNVDKVIKTDVDCSYLQESNDHDYDNSTGSCNVADTSNDYYGDDYNNYDNHYSMGIDNRYNNSTINNKSVNIPYYDNLVYNQQ